MNSSSPNKIIPPEVLLDAYSKGIFPMSESRKDSSVNWYSTRQRGIIPMNGFKVSSNVQRIIRQGRFTCRINARFRDVMKACANRKSTWISNVIINSFDVLHMAGHAQSVEMYDSDNMLVGGLYGVSLGAAFFGESMFKREKEADKIALWYCHQILKKNGFELWDTQFYTDHLAQFGCIEISSEDYSKRLEKAIRKNAVFEE